MNNPAKISIWSEVTDEKHALPRLGRHVPTAVTQVETHQLAENLRSFLEHFNDVFAAQPQQLGAFEVDEIELHLAVNAEGGIELVGKLSAGAQASMKIVLRRPTRTASDP